MVEPNDYRAAAFAISLIILLIASWLLLGQAPTTEKMRVKSNDERDEESLPSPALSSMSNAHASSRGGLSSILSNIQPPSSISDDSDEYD